MSTGWPLVQLGEVLHRSDKTIELQPDAQYSQITVKLWGKGVVLRGTVNGADVAASHQMVASCDQFILSRIDARNGAIGIVPAELDGAVVSSDFPLFDTKADRLVPAYLGWLCKTPAFVEMCQRASEGTTNRVRLQEEKFLTAEISLPTLEEQRRIVARIESMATQIQGARILRQQVAEEASALPGAEASKLFGKFRERLTIEAISEVRGGIQKGPHRAPGANPVRYLTVAHVQRNQVLTGNPRLFEVGAAELERWRLIPGDVLIIEGNGSPDQIGRTALFRGEIQDCVHQNHVIRIRPVQQKILPEFLNCFLNSPAGQDAVQAQSRTTSGLRTLSVGRIKSIAVPVPPIPDQRRIVARLDDVQAKTETLKALQAETSADLDALLPSILDKAFRGEL
jgi:type I restriction enzyme S subunit